MILSLGRLIRAYIRYIHICIKCSKRSTSVKRHTAKYNIKRFLEEISKKHAQNSNNIVYKHFYVNRCYKYVHTSDRCYHQYLIYNKILKIKALSAIYYMKRSLYDYTKPVLDKFL